MDKISDRIKEIDKEISNLYQERRILEMEQQEKWKELGYASKNITASADDEYKFILWA